MAQALEQWWAVVWAVMWAVGSALAPVAVSVEVLARVLGQELAAGWAPARGLVALVERQLVRVVVVVGVPLTRWRARQWRARSAPRPPQRRAVRGAGGCGMVGHLAIWEAG